MTLRSINFMISILLPLFFVASNSYSRPIYNEKPDSSQEIHNHDIMHLSPFFYLGAQTIVANLKYNYDTPKEHSHTSYIVDYTGVGFEIGGGIRYYNLELFVTGGYQFLNYWSGEYKVITHSANGTQYENVLITDHVYPKSLFNVSAGFSYRIKFSEIVQLNPFIIARTWKYSNNQFIPNNKKKNEFYRLDDNYSYGAGLSFKVILPSNSALGLKVTVLKKDFNPVGYFEARNAGNLEVTNNSLEVSLTYDFDFSGYKVEVFNHQFNFYE